MKINENKRKKWNNNKWREIIEWNNNNRNNEK